MVADTHSKQSSLTHWDTATVVEAFVSYLMISILTSLVNLVWVGLLAARSGWQSMTSSPLDCAPYECVCVHRLMSWSINQHWSLAAAGSGYSWPETMVTEMLVCFNPTQIWQKESEAAVSVCTVEPEHYHGALALTDICISSTHELSW